MVGEIRMQNNYSYCSSSCCCCCSVRLFLDEIFPLIRLSTSCFGTFPSRGKALRGYLPWKVRRFLIGKIFSCVGSGRQPYSSPKLMPNPICGALSLSISICPFCVISLICVISLFRAFSLSARNTVDIVYFCTDNLVPNLLSNAHLMETG